MKRIAGLVLALALAGCAGTPEWVKSGASPGITAQDLADCRSGAQAAVMRDTNIQTDIMVSRGRDWANSGALATQRASFAAETQGVNKNFVTRCMIAKGYAPGG